MKIALSRSQGIFFIMLCRQPFPKRNCMPLPISQMLRPMNRAWWTILWYSWKPIEGSVHEFDYLFTRLASKQLQKSFNPFINWWQFLVILRLRRFFPILRLWLREKNSLINTIQRLKSRWLLVPAYAARFISETSRPTLQLLAPRNQLESMVWNW